MSTILSLPSSAVILGNPSGNGGYDGGEDGSGREEVVRFACSWEDRAAMEETIRGFEEEITIGSTTLNRRVPLECPYSTGMHANAFRFRGLGKKNTNATRPYDKVIYDVTFGVFPFSTAGDTAYQSLVAQGSSRQITIPNRKYEFDGNGEIVDHGIAITYPQVSYLYSIFQIPDIAAFDTALLSLMATPVNNASLTIAGRTFAAGTVMLETYSSTQSRTMLGVQENTGQVVLNWSSLPWNKMVRSDGVVDTLTPAPYGTGNLSSITM